MASADTALKMREAEELNEAGLTSWGYREKDVAVRKCTRCGSPYWAKFSATNLDGVFSDCVILIYCLECLDVYDTDEIAIE